MSSMADRVWRATVAAEAAPSVSAGRISCAGVPAPVLGNHRSETEKSNISIKPSQKIGTDTPSADASANAPSEDEHWGIARGTASEMPKAPARHSRRVA